MHDMLCAHRFVAVWALEFVQFVFLCVAEP